MGGAGSSPGHSANCSSKVSIFCNPGGQRSTTRPVTKQPSAVPRSFTQGGCPTCSMALELPCPGSTTPGQAGCPVCQGRQQAGVPRESAGTPPDSQSFPLRPGVCPGREQENRGRGERGLCLNYHSPPPPCFTPEIKELQIYWLVGTNKLPVFHFPLTKRKSPAHQTPHLEEIKPALGPQLA